MLRLTGLPPVSRAPRATVHREGAAIVLRFLLVDGPVQRFRLPLYTLGDGADAEAAELRLLGELQALGYGAERLPSDETG